MPFINGGHIWLILVLVVVLVIFGPGKLPAIGSAFGKTITEFRKSTAEMKEEISRPKETTPPAADATVETKV